MELLEIGTSDSICKSITYCNDNMVGLTKVKCRVLPENYTLVLVRNSNNFNLVASWLYGREIKGDCYLIADGADLDLVAATLIDIIPNIKIAWPKIKEEW